MTLDCSRYSALQNLPHIQDSSTSSHKNLICLITLGDTVAFTANIHEHRGEFDLA